MMTDPGDADDIKIYPSIIVMAGLKHDLLDFLAQDIVNQTRDEKACPTLPFVDTLCV